MYRLEIEICFCGRVHLILFLESRGCLYELFVLNFPIDLSALER